MIQENGIWIPHSEVLLPGMDLRGIDEILKDVALLNSSIFFTTGQRTAIQAGGHLGVYPLKLSETFDWVYTFEPVADNYACLVKNINGVGNIIKSNKALSDKSEILHMHERDVNNSGMWAVDENGATEVQALSIDSLVLGDVDLIQLDVEGHELKALEGGLKTIKECQPVIQVEDRGHGESCDALLKELGYKLAMRHITDKIFVHKDKY